MILELYVDSEFSRLGLRGFFSGHVAYNYVTSIPLANFTSSHLRVLNIL